MISKVFAQREKKKCGRCSSCRHASIVFKKKWKPAEAGNTGQGKGTHVRAERTESTRVFGYTETSTKSRTEKRRNVPTDLGISLIKGDRVNSNKYEM